MTRNTEAVPTPEIKKALVQMVEIVRKKGSMNGSSLFSKIRENDILLPKAIFDRSVPFIAHATIHLTDKRERVECIKRVDKIFKPKLDYTCPGCPLLGLGGICMAGQVVRFEKSTDDRAAGPGASRAWRGRVPRRGTSP
ncbi:hypothetical protein KBB12_03235 [Candidatus Woesebacteria bacterium]|nr:hypothetical protein [Candidatus Woesebacteria bacterium]